jgi:four helix bundle protein
MHNFKNLKVWEKSMALAASVYKLMAAMPPEEKYGLTSQIKRCAISIPSNIAEGAGRNTNADFARFLDISNGSSNELETQLLLAQRLNFLDTNAVLPISNELDEIQKMNYKLINKLRE